METKVRDRGRDLDLAPEELERLVISSLSLVDDVLWAQRAGVAVDSFQTEEGQKAWEYVLARVTETGQVPTEVDLSTVGFTSIPGATDFRKFVDELLRQAAIRKARILIARHIPTLDADPFTAISAIQADLSTIQRGTKLHESYLDADALERFEDVRSRTEKVRRGESVGIPTGLPLFDTQGGEWQPGEMISVMGMPGSGKSTLILSFCSHAWAAGYRVLFVSPENSVRDIELRADPMLAFAWGVQLSNRALRSGQGVDLEVYRGYVERLQESRRWLTMDSGEAGGFTAADIRRKTLEFRPDVLAVDGGHLLRGNGKVWENIFQASKTLKAIAQELGITVLVACQATRNVWKGGGEDVPELGDAAYGAKAFMEDSNRVIGMAMDRGGALRRSIQVPKWRDGPVILYKVFLVFDVDSGKIQQQATVEMKDATVPSGHLSFDD